MSDGGLSSFQRRMRAIPEAVRKAVQPALVAAAEDVAATIRQLAPDDPATGAPDLKSSIAVTGPGQSTPPHSRPGGSFVVPENMAVVTVGNTDVRYPHMVEYGTVHSAAQPFFNPGKRLAKGKAIAKIRRAMTTAVRTAK